MPTASRYARFAIGLLWYIGRTACAESDLARAAAIAGATPTSLTACGLSAPDVSAFFTAVRGSAEQAALLAARTDAIMAEQNLRAVLRASDIRSETGAGAAAQALAQANAAKRALDDATTAFLDRARHDLPLAAQQRLFAWRLSPASLPAEFRVVTWSEADLKALQSALLAERLATAQHRPLAPGAASLLAQTRSRADVAQATTNLASQLPAVTTAFAQAVQ